MSFFSSCRELALVFADLGLIILIILFGNHGLTLATWLITYKWVILNADLAVNTWFKLSQVQVVSCLPLDLQVDHHPAQAIRFPRQKHSQSNEESTLGTADSACGWHWW